MGVSFPTISGCDRGKRLYYTAATDNFQGGGGESIGYRDTYRYVDAVGSGAGG